MTAGCVPNPITCLSRFKLKTKDGMPCGIVEPDLISYKARRRRQYTWYGKAAQRCRELKWVAYKGGKPRQYF